MVSVELQDTFLSLVRLGIGNGTVNGSRFTVHGSVDWEALKVLADRQGLSAVVLDALNTDGTNLTDTIPVQMKLEWIGEVLQNYEARYKAYEKAIGSLAGWYNQHGFKMMVLKGYACALDWPRPEHRPCGDIDIWLFGQQKEADAVLSHTDFTDFTDFTDKGSPDGSKSDKNLSQNQSRIGELENRIVIDNSHHHHTVFEWEGFTVENHYDFINVHHHKSHVALEKTLKELGQDDSYSVELSVLSKESEQVRAESLETVDSGKKKVESVKVYIPSPNLHALFLIKHLMLHFSTNEITFRQLLDWGFFVEKHGKDIDWKWFEEILDQFGMKKLYNIFNVICVEDLGFDAIYFQIGQYDAVLKERVLNEIFEPEFSGTMHKGLIRRAVFKYRRWKANEWKHELCYKESMWSAFWSGVWNHLLRPKTI